MKPLLADSLKYQCLADAIVSDEIRWKVAHLLQVTWPDPEWPVERIFDTIKAMNDRKKYRVLAWQGNDLMGHAALLAGTVGTERGPLDIIQFAGVCVAQELRGQQIGRKIVEWAFEKVGQPGLGVALFQTGVPGFYEKLGARCVDNRFVNSTNTEAPEANPWWDEHIMIYPADFDWPEGTIDLLGPGY